MGEELRCLVCGSSCAETVVSNVRDRLGVSKERWKFLRCSWCHTANLFPRPSASALESAYPASYTSDQSSRLSLAKKIARTLAYYFLHGPVVRKQCRWVLASFGKIGPNNRLLDIGCGSGAHLSYFSRFGINPVGLDLDPNATEQLRKRGFQVFCGSVEEFFTQVGPESFDIVTAFHVLEHLLDVQKVIALIWEMLKPNGCFCGAVPLAGGLFEKVFGRRWIAFTEAPRHVFVPTCEGLRHLLESRFKYVNFARESAFSTAALCALSIFPKATCSVFKPRYVTQIFAGALALALVPLAFAVEKATARWTSVLFAARKTI